MDLKKGSFTHFRFLENSRKKKLFTKIYNYYILLKSTIPKDYLNIFAYNY